jgi:pimeloyl-ACP methyl ester carboxylesterase
MENEILYEGKKIKYQEYGQGNPVILLHGFGEDSRVWNGLVDYLKGEFQLLVPDLPGSGGSEPIPDMSIEGLSEVIHAIIHEEEIDRAAVIGHSMGGYVALALAENYPNHLNSLGLFHSTAYADPEEKKTARKKGIEFINEHGPFEFLKTSIPNLFSPVSKERMADKIEEFIEQQHNFSAHALVSYYEAMMKRPDRTIVLKNSTLPILFIFGKHDTAVPLQDGLEQSHMPEKSYIHILPDSGHLGMLEEPKTANRIVKNYLNDVLNTVSD